LGLSQKSIEKMPRVIKRKKTIEVSVDPEAPRRGKGEGKDKTFPPRSPDESNYEYKKTKKRKETGTPYDRKPVKKAREEKESSAGRKKKDYAVSTMIFERVPPCVSRKSLIEYFTCLRARGNKFFEGEPESFTREFLYRTYKSHAPLRFY